MTDLNEYTIKTFGDLKEGDIIIDEYGNEVAVKKAYNEHLPETMYELTVENGTVIKASGNHLWYIETQADKANHQDRLIKAKKHLNSAPKVLFEGLEEIANLEESYEVTLLDLVDLFDYEIDPMTEEYSVQGYYLVSRILQSIGHIVEYREDKQDMSTGETVEGKVELLYDGRRAAQQILALTGEKKHTKRWPVIVGRVVTTTEIFEHYQDADIPTLEPVKENFLKRFVRKL